MLSHVHWLSNQLAGWRIGCLPRSAGFADVSSLADDSDEEIHTASTSSRREDLLGGDNKINSKSASSIGGLH